MKATDHFKNTIKAYLDKRAADDILFSASYAKQHKNIDECINYILTEVQESGCNGFTDDEVYSMAVHYYDEDNLGKINPISGSVVVNHHIELTEDEKREQHEAAVQQYREQIIAEMRRRDDARRKKPETKNATDGVSQLSLF